MPGRLCLFGEHSDWAGSYMTQNADLVEGQAIVTGINLGIYANAVKSKDFEVFSFDADGNSLHFQCEMHTKELKKHAGEAMLPIAAA